MKRRFRPFPRPIREERDGGNARPKARERDPCGATGGTAAVTVDSLDTATILASAVRTGRVLVVHEDNVSFGVGAEVAALVSQEAFYDLDAPVRRLAGADVPAMPFEIGLERALSITAADIAGAARSLLEE